MRGSKLIGLSQLDQKENDSKDASNGAASMPTCPALSSASAVLNAVISKAPVAAINSAADATKKHPAVSGISKVTEWMGGADPVKLKRKLFGEEVTAIASATNSTADPPVSFPAPIPAKTQVTATADSSSFSNTAATENIALPVPMSGSSILNDSIQSVPLENNLNLTQIDVFSIESLPIFISDTSVPATACTTSLTSPVNVVTASVTTPKTPVGAGSRKRGRSSGGSSSPKRKRPRNPDMHKAAVRKKLVNSGQAYTSTKGKEVAARQMRDPCACSMDCVHRCPQEIREENFQKYWGLGNHEKQWEFIRNHSSQSKTQSNYDESNDDDENSKRAVFRKYFFYSDTGAKISVCKFMFMATLGIWDTWITNAYSHINEEKGNVSTPDKRGRHCNHPCLLNTPAKIASVLEHVNSFPRVPSHYTRMRSKREYLETNVKSLSKMARLYTIWTVEKNLPKSLVATKRQYVDIVNSHFNIGFFKPKKDQCNLCSIMRNKDNNRLVTEKYKEKWIAHIRNKDAANALKKKDKAEGMKDRSIAVCSFDLQKQLQCPKSESSCFFYRNKLNVFNFTVFNMIKRMGCCFLWHEGLAKKGSAEISSALLMYIEVLHQEGYKEVIFFSDNCSGQNKNRYVFAMYIYAAVHFSMKITHRFLETGHTMMEVDSIHARIEKSTEDLEIFDFEDWVSAIENAKEESPRYQVRRLNRSNVVTFKSLVSKTNWEKNLKGNKIAWKNVREVVVNGNEGSLLQLRYDYNGEIITMSPNTVGRPFNFKNYCPPKAYSSTLPLKAKTLEDLQFYLDSMAVPISKHRFFQDVIAGVDPVDEDNVSDVEYNSDEELILDSDNRNEAEAQYVADNKEEFND